MKIDANLEERIDILNKKYPSFSREENLICTVSRWIHAAANSLIPDSPLTVAEGNIKSYEENAARNRPDNYLIKELREIVENAWKIYCNNKTLGVAK